MDPATISLLVSLAPSLLDLLFGDGMKNFSSLNKMLYGHGKHKKGGYVYPQVTDDASAKKWLAAYELNKAQAGKNPWVKFLKSKMPELKKEYLELHSAPTVETTEGKGAKHKRMLKKINEQIKKELEGLNEEDLVKIYHGGKHKKKGGVLYGYGDGYYGYGRVSYKALATAEALKKGVKLPKSAKSVGKTWKEIYEELTKS
jgi:hypothetical protein